MVAMLSEILEKKSEILELKEKREEILERLRSPSRSSFNGVSDHSRESRTERLYVKADELERQIINKLIELIDLETKVHLRIDRLQNEDYKDVLFSRYILGMKWTDIAKARECDLRWTYRLHERALKAFEQLDT